MRVLSTRWLTRGRGWAVSTPARANISRSEVPRNLDKAYPFLDYTSHIGCFRGLLKRISTVRQNSVASKRQEVPELGGTHVGQPILAAAGFQPAFSSIEDFRMPRISRLKGGCRQDCLLHKHYTNAPAVSPGRGISSTRCPPWRCRRSRSPPGVRSSRRAAGARRLR